MKCSKINEWCNNFQEKRKTSKGKEPCKKENIVTQKVYCVNTNTILKNKRQILKKLWVFFLQNKTKNTEAKFVSAIDDESVLRERKKYLFPQQCESNNRGGECWRKTLQEGKIRIFLSKSRTLLLLQLGDRDFKVF